MITRFPFEKARIPDSAEGQRRYMELACLVEPIVIEAINKTPCLICSVPDHTFCDSCIHNPEGAA